MDEYRQIAEEKLGRKLQPNEIVHHRDGDQHNNHPDNLKVVQSQSAHMKEPHLDSKAWLEKLKPYLSKDVDYRAESLNNALDTFFTPRQKQIIFRKLNNEPLSKTEREYYSRSIKKKLKALANPTLKSYAEVIIQSF